MAQCSAICAETFNLTGTLYAVIGLMTAYEANRMAGCRNQWRLIMITLELLQAALRFYTQCPDGQYDLDVVVPLIEAEIERRTA